MSIKEKKKSKNTIARGKRKRAIARATVSEGSGILRVNGEAVHSFNSPFFRQTIAEPLKFFDTSKLDIKVTVTGGGTAGQAQAARTAIAKALVARSGDEETRRKLLEFDRTLLVEDVRRVEPKKFKGPKARARFTKSYR
ncbi:TPA: 30S ribosomal protein S9 [Candidatus Micrarchaeota archaeon]|nr:MAG: 30S ribosomal protein S9 [Candidatus Micrarchaeota archaeon CG1_02_51_15]HII38989.1 30S ribosomal protein S9 [Candidatus Micrarchaeota archaeon]